MDEVWKDVVGFEDSYQVSSLGRVRSKTRVRSDGSLLTGRVLVPALNRDGYQRVILCVNNKRKYVSIHRLVADAFIPNPDNKPQVNHIDENKINNAVENLEWATSKENINWGTGKQRRIISQRVSQKHKKTVYQYDKNWNLVATYISCRGAARVCGIDRSGIQHCCNGAKGFDTYKGYIWRHEKIEQS